MNGTCVLYGVMLRRFILALGLVMLPLAARADSTPAPGASPVQVRNGGTITGRVTTIDYQRNMLGVRCAGPWASRRERHAVDQHSRQGRRLSRVQRSQARSTRADLVQCRRRELRRADHQDALTRELARSVVAVGFDGNRVEDAPLAELRAFAPGAVILFARNTGSADVLGALVRSIARDLAAAAVDCGRSRRRARCTHR